MGTQPRRMQNGLGQTLLADAVINDILKEAIAAARQSAGQPQLRAVTKLPRCIHSKTIRSEPIHPESIHSESVHPESISAAPISAAPAYTEPLYQERLYQERPAVMRLAGVSAEEPAPLAAAGGRRQ
jgi:hypothetical protein